ncbi:glutathione S-transferase family protein [Coralliovum pocilloporae]|uniref:glutathione S-transferase family protein n=1 Tax=Coralliovum pocilloporae TaxID=3066369 RepID=UPI0033075759
MMILRSSPPSPFGRKVKIAAAILGLSDRITVELADTTNPEDSLRQQNPLGKIPILVLEDGGAIYDSRIILEYLDSLSAEGNIIPKTADRYKVLTRAALADGVCDAALLTVYEGRLRAEEHQSSDWLSLQAGKIERGLAALDADRPEIGETPMVDAIALACVLGYLDLRFDGKWRETWPGLVAWLDAFEAAVPSFGKTRPS